MTAYTSANTSENIQVLEHMREKQQYTVTEDGSYEMLAGKYVALVGRTLPVPAA